MSTNSAQPSPELPDGARNARQPVRAILLCASVIWLVGFNLYFYSLSLPNNKDVHDDPIPRLRVWQELPYYLMLLPPEDAPPSGWSYLPQRFDLLLVAAVILAGAWGWGHLLLRLTRAALPHRSAERTVLAFGLGFSALSLLTLGCGLMGLLSRPLLAGLIAAGVAIELVLRAGWLGRSQ